MAFSETKTNNILKYITLATLFFMVCAGLYQVVCPVRPFWIDEWSIIYNLKFKSPADLRGPLVFMQQFPRVYLLAVKWFSSQLDYSYFSLRFPSFFVGVCTMVLGYRLMGRLFSGTCSSRFLFVLAVISASTFTEYFVQVKQYTMDIFLSLAALAQLLVLLRIAAGKQVIWWRYALLCAGFAACPFFSYTYPIVIAPVFATLAVQAVRVYKCTSTTGKGSILAKTAFPLVLCAASIVVFYKADVAQVMKDCGMKQYWGDIMMVNGFNARIFFRGLALLFAQVGSGLLFQVIFGVLGFAGFVYAVAGIAAPGPRPCCTQQQVRLYCVSLLTLVLLLFAAGKLPVGEARLNSFTVPAITILVVCFIAWLATLRIRQGVVTGLILVIFAGTAGHIFTSYKKAMTGAEHQKRLALYIKEEQSIKRAQAADLPLVVPSAAAYPYDTVINFPGTSQRANVLCYPDGRKNHQELTSGINMPADWVIKTLPAYSVRQNMPVYAIDRISDTTAGLPARFMTTGVLPGL